MFYMLQVKELAFIMQCCLLYRITDMTHSFTQSMWVCSNRRSDLKNYLQTFNTTVTLSTVHIKL